jgi:hypothetical protein
MTLTRTEQELVWARQLYESRLKLKGEMRAALLCRTKKEKLDLVKRWKLEYSPTSVNEMLRIAKNKSAAGDIANWDIEKMSRP